MRKIIYFILLFIFLILLNNCSGYKPIFAAGNIEFNINKHTIKDNKILGNKFYSKLYNLSKSNKNKKNSKSLNILISAKKEKSTTSKNSAGKTLEYRIVLTVKTIITDAKNDEKIMDEIFTSSINYNVQDQYSDTLKLENKSTDELLDATYRKFLIKFSEKIISR